MKILSVAPIALVGVGLACAPPARPGVDPGVPVPSAPPSLVAPPRVALTAAPPAPRTTDPLWQAARSADPLDGERLALAVGAAGLLIGLREGGEAAETAMSALPFADDGAIALRELADLARAESPRRRPALGAILGIAARLPHSREQLDAEGARACGVVVVAIARDEHAAREDRALATSAARALAERGYVERAALP